ncbi:hypothetical protein [Novosphingobium sp.]|uniref:hypothetical protein n=1 Tax=Novosphingobium sp. TaxID=1874826 RepID=UPI0038B74A3D
MKHKPILGLIACLLMLSPVSGPTALAAPVHVPVVRAEVQVPGVSVAWVHARLVDRGIVVTGRLQQGAGRATRASVLVTAAVGKVKTASTRSSAFAVGGGGATFSVVLPLDHGDDTAPVTIAVVNLG